MSSIDWLWSRVRTWWQRDATHLTYLFFPDTVASPQPYQSYIRVWLSEMFLAHDREHAVDRRPALQASIRLDFAGSPGVTFATLVRPPEGQLGPGVRRQVKLTELLPYSGGSVEVQAALLDIEGMNHLKLALDLLQDFSSLLVPPLGMALTVAEKVANGIARVDEAVDASGQAPILAFDETFASPGANVANIVRAGHHVVVRAPEATFSPGSLRVVDGQLQRVSDASGLTGYDYLVLTVESRKERDDWRFPRWDALIGQAIAAQAAGNTAEVERLKSELVSQIFTSADLTPADRKRVASMVFEELAPLGLGAVGEPTLETVADLVAHRGLPDEVAVGELTLAELVA